MFSSDQKSSQATLLPRRVRVACALPGVYDGRGDLVVLTGL